MAGADDHLEQLDGLRAVAVAAVLLWHFVPESAAVLPWDPLGVRLFFVLSGFLITGILLRCRGLVRDDRGSVPFLMRQFYARRFLRIVPIYYLTVLVAAAVDLPPTRATLAWHLGYATNVYIITRAETWPGSLAHFWSLAVEEQFYLLWPCIVLVLPERALRPTMMWMLAIVAPAFRVTCRALGLWGGSGSTSCCPRHSTRSRSVRSSPTCTPRGPSPPPRSTFAAAAGWPLGCSPRRRSSASPCPTRWRPG